MRAAIAELALRVKVVAAGADGSAYAAGTQPEAGPRTVAIVSGGNIAPALLTDILAGA